jgi:dihydrolipoamide dehydrogenase
LGIDIVKMRDRTAGIISTLHGGVCGLLSQNGVTQLKGNAEFLDRHTLNVAKDEENVTITARHIVVATGAVPRMLAGLETFLQDGLVWTSKEALKLDTIPKSLLILGSGAIGIELASFYNSVGSDVTVVEIQDRILVQEDIEISEAAMKAYTALGIKILPSTTAQNFVEDHGGLSVDLKSRDGHNTTARYERVIVAIGVVPNTRNLGLEQVGVKLKQNGAIEVKMHQETSVPGIYAIGDVAEGPWLAHKASREGIIVAEKIANLPELSQINLNAIPACTYSNPQIASIGASEELARQMAKNIKVGKSYFKRNGKALAAGEGEGFVKVVFDGDTGELLGAHMIGPEVTELLPVFSLAISAELTANELKNAIFPHPTLSECLQEAVIAAFR